LGAAAKSSTKETLGLRGSEDIKKSIRDMWDEADHEILRRWRSEKLSLAPGEEVLQILWQRFSGRNYRKDEDGPQIAAEMSEPPADLASIIGTFLSDEDKTPSDDPISPGSPRNLAVHAGS
jgi:hypothetical protein